MEIPRSRHSWWIAPLAVGLVGVALSYLAFRAADEADAHRVRNSLESRAEWRARDIEAKIRLSGNAVENMAIAMAANEALDRAHFERIAQRARHQLDHVGSLQWAPRVRREEIAAFEQAVRASGVPDFRVFDVSPDFRRTELADREAYYPVLYEKRFHGDRRVLGLALGRHEGRGIPMRKALEEGRPVATLPVRPIGPPTPVLVYLLFWPVYDGVEVPAGSEERRARFRGYVLGNFDVAKLLAAALRDTPEAIETIRFAISAEHPVDPATQAAATYDPGSGSVEIGARPGGPAAAPAVRIARHFEVFDQHWDLTFDYSAAALAPLRSQRPWGWLLAGLVLTGSLTFYLLRAHGRTQAIEALVAERTEELERTGEQLHQAQKMEAIGNLTGGMAHDFNNLLAIVIGNLELLKDRVGSRADAAGLVETALRASTRGAELTRQLLAFARRQPLEPKTVEVSELVAGTARLLERMLEGNITVRLVSEPGVWPVTIDPAQLSSAIVNLATNARDAMPKGGRLTIETRNTQLDAEYAAVNADVVPGDFVLVEVSDSGTGMTAETLSHVFEPFYTTKEAGRGTGLGLSMVFGFVKQSRGHIKIYSEPGEGTSVRLYLPRAAAAAPLAGTPPPAAEPQQGQGSVLLVEDDADVRRIVAAQLADLGYAVVEAQSPQAALALLQGSEPAVDLLFTDLVMPGRMNGYELAAAALVERPGLKVLYTSGYSDSALRHGARLGEAEHFLSKPYRKQDLARKLKEVLDG